MLLRVATALALALTIASASAAAFAFASAATLLPATQPGLSADEGVFLQTDADDGSQVNYFIAQGARHAIQDDDLQAELRLNPLWPYRVAARDEVLAFPEGAPIGTATIGRLSEPAGEQASEQASEPAVALAEDDPAPSAGDAADLALAQPEPAPTSLTEPVPTDVVEPAATDLAEPEPSDLAEPGPGLTYTVQRGDTLLGIAARFGVSEADLLADNAISSPNRIYAGQVLVVGA